MASAWWAMTNNCVARSPNTGPSGCAANGFHAARRRSHAARESRPPVAPSPSATPATSRIARIPTAQGESLSADSRSASRSRRACSTAEPSCWLRKALAFSCRASSDSPKSARAVAATAATARQRHWRRKGRMAIGEPRTTRSVTASVGGTCRRPFRRIGWPRAVSQADCRDRGRRRRDQPADGFMAPGASTPRSRTSRTTPPRHCGRCAPGRSAGRARCRRPRWCRPS